MNRIAAGALAIAITVSAIVGLVVGAIYLPNFSGILSRKGILIIKLTDAPVELKHLNLTITSLSALRVEHIFSFPYKETWEELSFTENASQVYVDILALRNVTKDLSITEIPPGKYNKLRMTIATANATFIDGENMDLVVPPGHIDVIIDFDVEGGRTTVLLVDVQADWAAISHSGRLRPILKATVISEQ